MPERTPVHDYSKWPVPTVAPTTSAPACGCDDPRWLFADNASYGCANCCRLRHPSLREHECPGRTGRWFGAFTCEHARLEAEIEVRGLDRHRLPVPETDERVVSLRAALVRHIRAAFVRRPDGSYISNKRDWPGFDFAKTTVGNMLAGTLDWLGYPAAQEVERAIAEVESRPPPDFGNDPRVELAELRRECMLCAWHHDEDRRSFRG